MTPEMPRARREICVPFPATLLELCQRLRSPMSCGPSVAVTLEVHVGRGRTTVASSTSRTQYCCPWIENSDRRQTDRYAHNGWVKRFFRYFWAGPATLIGLVVALALIRRGRVACVDGVVEAHSPLLERALASFTPLARGAEAMTLGHVVLGRDARALEMTRAHERVHVRQYESWGPLFLPAYFLAGACALAMGRHPYFDNRFERAARRAESEGS